MTVADAIRWPDPHPARRRLPGCSLAEVTIRQGIEPLLRARLPAMTGLIDVTDHEAGTDPFFSPEKR